MPFLIVYNHNFHSKYPICILSAQWTDFSWRLWEFTCTNGTGEIYCTKGPKLPFVADKSLVDAFCRNPPIREAINSKHCRASNEARPSLLSQPIRSRHWLVLPAVQRRDTGGYCTEVVRPCIPKDFIMWGIRGSLYQHEAGFSWEIVDAEEVCGLPTGRNAQRRLFSRTGVVGGNGPRSVVRPREDWCQLAGKREGLPDDIFKVGKRWQGTWIKLAHCLTKPLIYENMVSQ